MGLFIVARVWIAGFCLVENWISAWVLGLIGKGVSGLAWPAPPSSLPPPLDGDPRSSCLGSASPLSPLAVVDPGDGSGER